MFEVIVVIGNLSSTLFFKFLTYTAPILLSIDIFCIPNYRTCVLIYVIWSLLPSEVKNSWGLEMEDIVSMYIVSPSLSNYPSIISYGFIKISIAWLLSF